MNKKFETYDRTLRELNDWKFIIPSYQRPYVWKTEQVEKLLLDFYEAFEEKESMYYVGTILLYSEKENIFNLIDGQQRFTTLWLIAIAFKMLALKNKSEENKSEIEAFLKAGDELRIDFAIRKQIKSYMLSILESKGEKAQYSDTEIEDDEYLVNIANALVAILRILKEKDFEENDFKKKFGDFLYNRVHFVVNIAPKNTKMNKLFTTINNSGVQLEQSDILKSKLLEKINKNERPLYSHIWKACENMGNYFEHNVKELFGKNPKWAEVSDYTDLKEFKFHITENNTEYMESSHAYTIDKILRGDVITGEKHEPMGIKYEEGEGDSLPVYFRSIISFPQLLIHAYRIFLEENGKEDFSLPFQPDKLLEIFCSGKDALVTKEKSEDTVKRFFKCLWTVRWAFDNWIVKWIYNVEGKEEELLLTKIVFSDGSFSREKKEQKSNVSMLQNMLYFAYNTQIWLTPYLKRLIDDGKTRSIDDEYALSCLKGIDNLLSLRGNLSAKEITFKLMKKDYDLNDKFNFENYLNDPKGTGFNRYWFQKLEFILWKELKEDPKEKSKPEFINYRITSKNSIEHIHPQTPEFGKPLDRVTLDAFGNLALLNVSQNASYSNLPFKIKKEYFEGNKKKKGTYDSLKLKLIYELDDFTEKNIREHQDAMIKKIKDYYDER